MTKGSPASTLVTTESSLEALSTSSTRVGIIGTGFGGMAAAIELRRAGYRNLVIFEKAADVGGVWRENTYPGAACDVPSHYYSLSSAPRADWPRRFSRQPTILSYMNNVATDFDLRSCIRFGAEVTTARFDSARGCWSILTSDGTTTEVDVLVPAVGQLSRPSLPNIPGRGNFAGSSFHSAEWDHTVDLAGKRVAVIGSGASAIQFVPEIQPEVGDLLLFQRTPPHLLPRPDGRFGAFRRWLFAKVPFTQRMSRFGWYAVMESLGVALLRARPLADAVTLVCRIHMKFQTRTASGLFAKIWPHYPLGCKRILLSSNYLPALTRPNVEVITEGIHSITADGLITDNGALHTVDVIIYGTGFTATDFLAPLKIEGLGGRDLRQEWADGAHAYLGITVPHFPNLFLMYGPNTNLGAGSIIAMLEAQARYIRQALDYRLIAPEGQPMGGHETPDGHPPALVVNEQVATEFDLRTQHVLASGVWSQCSSWYRLPNGRIPTNWPGTVGEYRRRTARFDPSDFETLNPE